MDQLATVLKQQAMLLHVIGAHVAALVASHPQRQQIETAATQMSLAVQRQWFHDGSQERLHAINSEIGKAIQEAHRRLSQSQQNAGPEHQPNS